MFVHFPEKHFSVEAYTSQLFAMKDHLVFVNFLNKFVKVC